MKSGVPHLGLERDKFAKDGNNGNMHQSDKLDLSISWLKIGASFHR